MPGAGRQCADRDGRAHRFRGRVRAGPRAAGRRRAAGRLGRQHRSCGCADAAASRRPSASRPTTPWCWPMGELFQPLRRRAFGTIFVALVLVWLAGMVLAPNIMMIDYALRPEPAAGADRRPRRRLLADQHRLSRRRGRAPRDLLQDDLGERASSRSTTFVVCYPVALLAGAAARRRRSAIVLLALTIPFWINEVLRTLAWYIILAFRGPLNAMLHGRSASSTRRCAGTAMAACWPAWSTPTSCSCCFRSTTPSRAWRRRRSRRRATLAPRPGASIARIVIPHAKAGIATGCVFTFMLAAGSYVAPALLGAPGSRWFTEIIYNWFFEGGDWNRGAAYALVLLVLCLAVVLVTLEDRPRQPGGCREMSGDRRASATPCSALPRGVLRSISSRRWSSWARRPSTKAGFRP